MKYFTDFILKVNIFYTFFESLEKRDKESIHVYLFLLFETDGERKREGGSEYVNHT